MFKDAVNPAVEAPGLEKVYDLLPGFIYQHALKGMSAVVPAGRLEALKHDPRVAYVVEDMERSISAQAMPTGIQRIFADANPEIAINGSDDYRVDVDVAVNAGVAFAVAAGNDDDNALNYSPGGFDNVLSVSALADFDGIPGWLGSPTCRTDQDDTLADFSNWGPQVDIAAPGVCILSTYPLEQGEYGTISGTSMASPHAAGALALLASVNNPSNAASVYALYNQVKSTGNYNWTDDSGDGIQEPLLDVSNVTIFNPALIPGGGGGPTEPPAAPTNLSAATISSSQVNLSWTDNASTEDGFKIERCTGLGCSDFAQIATVGAGVTSYANTGLVASTNYSYRVRAYNTAGDSGYSNTANATTSDAPALPLAPTDLLAAVISRSQINLSWTDNASNEVGYYVERCKGSTCTNFTRIATLGANVTFFANTGLAKNTTYRYRVQAYNAAGVSAYSNIVMATTLKR